jgi:hypothetical protein
MRITQADFRTVRIVADGLSVLLRYSLYQNFDERLPESIACRGDQVTAYFLTSTIRDFIAAEEHGLSIQRSWNVLQEGRVGLSFCLEFPELTGAAWLLPGVARGESVPLQAEPVDGALTALPGAVYLLAGRASVLVFTDPPPGGRLRDSVELARLVEEEEPRVRVELHRPPRVGAGSAAGRKPKAGQPALQVKGSLEHAVRLNVVIAPSRELFARGVAAALARLAAASRARPTAAPGYRTSAPEYPAFAPALGPAVPEYRAAAPSQAALQARTREEVADCRERLLVSEGGTCGLRLSPGEEILSTSVGAGLASLLPRLLPGDQATEELALRLADFALRAQLPSGLFYERYDLRRRSWLEAEGRKARAPAVLPAQSADTASALLVLAGLLRRRRVPHARYLHAAARAVGALSAAAAGPASEEQALVLAEPLAELFLLTGKDAHKKTLAGIRDRFFAQDREPAAADSVQPALLRARAAAALTDAGFALKGLEACLHSLLPWVHLNPGEAGPEPCGGLHETLGGSRLLFRGFELAHLLARLAARQPPRAFSLRALMPQLLAFSLRQPAGTSYLSLSEPAAQALGPVDSRILVRELTARHRLLEEFPQFFPKGAARPAGAPLTPPSRPSKPAQRPARSTI